MEILKRSLKYLILAVLFGLLSFPFWINRVPLEKLSFLLGKTAFLDEYVCNYSIRVSGDSMEPIIARGSSIELDRCFEAEDLTEGLVVLFGRDSELHLGIIRHFLPLDPVVYKISNERPNERLQDVVIEEITAVSREIDTGGSSYQPVQDVKSLILNPDEYLTDFYLGKIPRGYGEEMAEVEETNIFYKNHDKFCMVVIPKKELAFVEIEIIEAETRQVVDSHENIVFNVRSKPNTNCQDFGTGEGMIDLDTGSYRYRFLLNHQVLADIPFKVE